MKATTQSSSIASYGYAVIFSRNSLSLNLMVKSFDDLVMRSSYSVMALTAIDEDVMMPNQIAKEQCVK